MMRVFYLSLLGLLLAQHAYAKKAFEFSGFGVIGLSTSSSNGYQYRADVSYDKGVGSGELDLLAVSNLGLQMDVSATDKLSSTFQVVIKDRSRTSFDEYISQAFLKYQFSPQWEIRLGRMPIDLFALSEYRDINIAYPWAVTPHEVYGIIPHRNLNGFDVSHSSTFSHGNLRTRMFLGNSENVASLGSYLELVKTRYIHGVSLDWSRFNWSVVAKYSRFEFDNNPRSFIELSELINSIADSANQLGAEAVYGGLGEVIPELLPSGRLWNGVGDALKDLSMTGKNGNYSSISVNYRWEKLGVSVEASQIESESGIMPDIRSGFISWTYTHGQSTFFSILAAVNTEADNFDSSGVSSLLEDPNSLLARQDVVGSVLAKQFAGLQEGYFRAIQGASQAVSVYAADQTSFSLGWRYDIKENVALKVQLNRSIIAAQGGTLWKATNPVTKAEHVNTAFITLGFTF